MRGLKTLALCLMLLCLTACGGAQRQDLDAMEPTGTMSLEYAQQFAVDYYPGDLAVLTIGEDRFLLVPEDAEEPEDPGIPVLHLPLDRVYLASSSVMDLFLRCGALDHVGMTSTDAGSWTIPEVAALVADQSIRYVGKYSAPDYEYLLEAGCALAVENTMIYHCPDTKEQLERLGIPVLVERSSYEAHPLGRLEWIKLYGLLTGKLPQAEAFFSDCKDRMEAVSNLEHTGKTAVFFYITSSGYANVRKPGDYISRMIELAGGENLLSGLPAEENALSTMNIDLETFYAEAREADVLIYNSTVAGELETMEDLLDQYPMLADFRAVQTGDVWCTEQNMFQRTGGAAEMVEDFHKVFAETGETLTYLHRLH